MFSPVQAEQVLGPYGVTLSTGQLRAVGEYARLLLLWNQKFNLTRITKPDQILARHFGESFFAAEKLVISGGRLADVGTGAGFPGLALKIIRPSLQVTLIEPNLKKAAFLAEVTRSIGLAGVTILRARTDTIRPSEVHADHVTARAVGNVGNLLAWARMALSVNGSVILWLGIAEADQARKTPGWAWQEPIPIPGSARSFLVSASPRP